MKCDLYIAFNIGIFVAIISLVLILASIKASDKLWDRTPKAATVMESKAVEG